MRIDILMHACDCLVADLSACMKGGEHPLGAFHCSDTRKHMY